MYICHFIPRIKSSGKFREIYVKPTKLVKIFSNESKSDTDIQGGPAMMSHQVALRKPPYGG